MKKYLLPFFLVFSLLAGCKDSGSDPAPQPEPEEETPANDAVVYAAKLANPKPILLNASGYNPRNFIYDNPWTNAALDQKFQLGLVKSEANTIRYPGGTFGNFWNFEEDRLFRKKQTNAPGGWVDENKIENAPTLKQIKNDKLNLNTVADLKYAAKGGSSGRPLNVVFQMNMVTPGADFYAWKWGRPVDETVGSADWYAMLDDRYNRFKSMLLRAKSGPDPIDVKYIELGNEYYFPHAYCIEAFPDGAAHGTACNYIAQKLKTDPELNLGADLSIAATATSVYGGPDQRKINWNKTLKSTLDKSKVGYVTMHVYKAFEQPSSYTETNFHNQLVAWYQFVDRKFNESEADTYFLNDNWQVWYTETNANWDANADETTPSSESKWIMNLMDAFSVLHLYDKGNAAMVLQFQFNNQVAPNTNGELYHRALALIPYMKASRGATSASRISFAATGMPTFPNSPKEVVQGYCFISPEGVKKCVLLNLSGTVKNVDLAQSVFKNGTGTLTVESYHNPLLSGTAKPSHTSESSTAAKVSLKPYSVNYVHE